MIRVINILVFVIVTTFYMNCRAADMVMAYSEIQSPETISGENDVILKQDHSAFLFVYWDEHVRTTLSEFEKTNRQSPKMTVLSLMGHTSPVFECFADPMDKEFPHPEMDALATAKFIVISHKYRI